MGFEEAFLVVVFEEPHLRFPCSTVACGTDVFPNLPHIFAYAAHQGGLVLWLISPWKACKAQLPNTITPIVHFVLLRKGLVGSR